MKCPKLMTRYDWLESKKELNRTFMLFSLISIFSLIGGLFVLPFFGVTTITWMYVPIVIGTTFLLLSLVTL